LRCFANVCPKKWLSWLSLAEFWYNTSYHSSLGKSPFEALYGHPPRHFGISSDQSCTVDTLEQWLKDRQVTTKLIKQHLSHVMNRMKQQAGKGRLEREFAVGDIVFLKLQSYIQSSLAPRANKKQAFKFFNPFLVYRKLDRLHISSSFLKDQAFTLCFTYPNLWAKMFRYHPHFLLSYPLCRF
jgi:hypothetical protein